VKKAKDYKYKNLNNEKTNNFVKFSNEFLNELNKNTEKKNYQQLTKDFDFFIVGSDQVWNPLYKSNFYKYFLPFSPLNKNLTYAPSFGVEALPNEYKEQYKKWLSNFKHISVREEAGQKIIKDLLGIDVPVLVDPTLLLKKDEWLQIAKPHVHKPNKKYLLTYYLGKEKKHNLKFIKQYAKNNDLELVHLGDIKDKLRYTADPSEFIDYFNNASIIFTDSFHGSIFSIIFKKPFVIFKRGNMNSRIDTLLSKFHLENRHWDYVKEHKNFNDIDYSHVDEIINEERKKSFDYLRNALGIKKEE
jgi:hypothetical protein